MMRITGIDTWVVVASAHRVLDAQPAVLVVARVLPRIADRDVGTDARPAYQAPCGIGDFRPRRQNGGLVQIAGVGTPRALVILDDNRHERRRTQVPGRRGAIVIHASQYRPAPDWMPALGTPSLRVALEAMKALKLFAVTASRSMLRPCSSPASARSTAC